MQHFLLFLMAIVAVAGTVGPAAPGRSARAAQELGDEIRLLDRDGKEITSLTDGDRVQLELSVDQAADRPRSVGFFLDTPDLRVAECTLTAEEKTCRSAPFNALGWYWGAGAQPRPRRIGALLDGEPLKSGLSLEAVRPRPVVLVHGFISSAAAWEVYTGPNGLLASLGIPAFAVGDGQAPGTLNTGSIAAPLRPTNTLLENAELLDGYLAGVRRQTGAQMVDLVVHSMGGMISRVYIDRYMGEQNPEEGDADKRSVAQLIMLGSPSLGTDCSVLPSALGWYLPASLEIRSAYARSVLNQNFTRRKGVPFYAVAGTSILDPVGSPCTGIPSDIVIARSSVHAIPLILFETPRLHTELNTSPQVFDEFVRPLLQKSPADFASQPDSQPALPAADDAAQFTRLFSGRVATGGMEELIIPIESGIAVAGFALFDPTRSLETVVIGAGGNEIELDPLKNGEIHIDDPETMLHLGYGFADPRPGAWRVQLHATDVTPAEGAEYALTARFSGGAILEAAADPVVVEVGQPVRLSGQVKLGEQALPVSLVEVRLISPRGEQRFALQTGEASFSGEWTPQQPGTYGVDLTALAALPDGTPIERSIFLAVVAQPAGPWLGRATLIASAASCLLALAVAGALGAWLILRRRRPAR